MSYMEIFYLNLDMANVITDAVNTLLMIAGTLARIVLVWGGITYIGSAGSTEQAQSAKKWITYAILGLLLVLFSYAILAVINNDIVR